MKKIRVLALALALVMVVSLFPMAALAAENGVVYVFSGVFDSDDAKADSLLYIDPSEYDEITVSDKKVVIKASDYDKILRADNTYYELKGLHTWETLANNEKPKSSVEIDAYSADNAQEWFDENSLVLLAYGTHEHHSDVWYASLTNHWQHCDDCGFLFGMDWHHDEDGDNVCDDCGNEIHYYEITVAESTGGKVTVSKEKAALNDVIDVTITPDDGYQVKSVAFYNDNDVHSQVCQYVDEPGKAYHFTVLPWNVEVVVEFEPVA